ncbi:MAG TPA: type 1 glutamine amidotransferase [Candidatus Binataceae bacterium]|nr:type 1 glutamine amidotransferase [Candidatus Binataceae bacterium]
MAQGSVRVLALRHIMCEYLGGFERFFTDAGAQYNYIDTATGGELPRNHDGYDVLVVLGGPMSVNDTDEWLNEEKRFVREAVERGKTTVGFCLGAQMIAKVFGAKVAPGERKEVGFMNIDVAETAASDPLLKGLARPHQIVYQLHQEGFELPSGAVRLASSAAYPNQAYRLGERCWGMQFHIEIDHTMLVEWVKEYWGEPATLPADSYARVMLRDAEQHLPKLEPLARTVANNIIKIAAESNSK